MPYSTPSPYPFIKRYEIDVIDAITKKERHTFFINGITAATNADGLLKTLLNDLYGFRFDVTKFLVLETAGSPLSPYVSFVKANRVYSQVYARVDVPVVDLYIQANQPMFSFSISFGDAMDILFNDQNAVQNKDQYVIQFELERVRM